jgi:hypothetical protein
MMSRVENGWGNAAQRRRNDSNVDDVHGATGREGVAVTGWDTDSVTGL